MNVFFVCGAPKSGTTWLQRILDAHPLVCCSGEGHFIDRFAGPVAEVVRTYNQALQLEAAEVYEGRPYYAPVSQVEFDALARVFILGRMRARAHRPDLRAIGDKTPLYTERLGDLSRIFPEGRFLHIVRDPRDVVVSRLAHNHRAGNTAALVTGAPEQRAQVEAAVGQWMRAVQAVDAFAAAHPGQVHELHYRDLHAAPEREIGRAFAFLDVPTPPELVAEIARVTSFEAMTGRKPGQEDLGAFLRNGAPDDWRAKLDREAADFVEQVCGELMRAKGLLPLDGEVRGVA